MTTTVNISSSDSLITALEARVATTVSGYDTNIQLTNRMAHNLSCLVAKVIVKLAETLPQDEAVAFVADVLGADYDVQP